MIQVIEFHFSSLKDTSLMISAPKIKSQEIIRSNGLFKNILKEYHLDFNSYYSLYNLDKGLLKTILNKKKISLLVFNKEMVIGINGDFNSEIIQYVNNNNFPKISFEPDVIKFESRPYEIYVDSFSNSVRVYALGDANSMVFSKIEIDRMPMFSKFNILDFSPIIINFDALKDRGVSIYDVNKFKHMFQNYTDLVLKICKSLNIRDLSEVKNDFKNILINMDLKDHLISVLSRRGNSSFSDIFEFAEYFISDKYKDNRSNLYKTITI